MVIEAASAVWLAWAHRFPTLPTRFTASPSDELHIAVIGGSSAKGQPYQDWLSIGPIVAWKLQAALPGRRVVADVLAREGATLEEMHQKLERIKRRPDVLIIFAGHNEFQARFPWDQDGDRPGSPLPYALEVVMQDGLGSPLFRCVSEAFGKYRLMAPPRIVHRGPIEPPIVRRAESERILDEFGRRLEAIVSWCERIGAVPVLVIPADNQSGYEPNRSVLPVSVSPEERRAFGRDWLAARSTESDPAPAMARYRALIARHPGFAEAHFRLARLLEQIGALHRGRSRLSPGPGPRRVSPALPDLVPGRLPPRGGATRLHLDRRLRRAAGDQPTRHPGRSPDQRRTPPLPPRPHRAGGGGAPRAPRPPGVRLVPRNGPSDRRRRVCIAFRDRQPGLGQDLLERGDCSTPSPRSSVTTPRSGRRKAELYHHAAEQIAAGTPPATSASRVLVCLRRRTRASRPTTITRARLPLPLRPRPLLPAVQRRPGHNPAGRPDQSSHERASDDECREPEYFLDEVPVKE